MNISFLQIFSLLLFQLPYGSMLLVYSLSTSNVVKDSYRSAQGTFLYTFYFLYYVSKWLFVFEFSYM